MPAEPRVLQFNQMSANARNSDSAKFSLLDVASDRKETKTTKRQKDEFKNWQEASASLKKDKENRSLFKGGHFFSSSNTINIFLLSIEEISPEVDPLVAGIEKVSFKRSIFRRTSLIF